MDVIWKGAIGRIVTALIVLASKKGDVLPGVLPLAPTFAIIALLAVGAKGDPEGFHTACLAGAKTMPAYLLFLGVCWLLVGRIDYRLAIFGGLAAWSVAAYLKFVLPQRG